MPYCILCKTYSLKFESFNNRSGVGCPNCHSAERHRLFGYYYEKYIAYKKNLSVLHFAPETCLHSLLKLTVSNYICGDLDPAKFPDKQCVQLDATQLPFPPQSFDLILASHILEHIPDDIKALSEMRRVLKPKGILIVLIPQNFSLETTDEDPNVVLPEDRVERFGQADHVRTYGLDFGRKLKEAGFSVKAYAPHSRLLDVEKMGLDSVMNIADESTVRDNKFSPWDVLYECTKN